MEVACHFKVSLSQLSFDNICNYACCRMKKLKICSKTNPKTNQPSPFQLRKNTNSRSASSAHLALKKKKKINPPTGCAQNRDIKKGFYVHLELFSTYYDWLLDKAICDSDWNFGRIFKEFQSCLLQREMFDLMLEPSRFLIWTADGFVYYLLKKTKTENAFVYKKELHCFSRKKENNCTI